MPRIAAWTLALACVAAEPAGAQAAADVAVPAAGNATEGTAGDGAAAMASAYAAWQEGDATAALAGWRTAARLGNTDAMYNAGLVLLRAPDGRDEGQEWLARAAGQDHVLACFALGTELAVRDPVRAETLLTCAARHGYVPAQFNLARLLADAGRHAEARAWYETAAVTFDPAARALAELPRPALAAAVEQDPAPVAPPAMHALDWVLAQPPERYTLQVAAGSSAASLERMLERHVVSEPAASFYHRPRSSEPFSAIVGSYADFAAAERALAGLPAALQANAPWIRRFGTLQHELHARVVESTADAAPGEP